MRSNHNKYIIIYLFLEAWYGMEKIVKVMAIKSYLEKEGHDKYFGPESYECENDKVKNARNEKIGPFK
jgi:hypothetical protein